MTEISPEILIPAAVALSAVAAAALWSWLRRERAMREREAQVRRREAELRAIARRRQREQEQALDDWVNDDSRPASTFDTAPGPVPGTTLRMQHLAITTSFSARLPGPGDRLH